MLNRIKFIIWNILKKPSSYSGSILYSLDTHPLVFIIYRLIESSVVVKLNIVIYISGQLANGLVSIQIDSFNFDSSPLCFASLLDFVEGYYDC